MGLPYILGDKDPKDPINGWDKTWAYLKELGQYVDYLPVRHDRDDEEPGQRHGRTSSPRTTGWDINPRVLGTVPEGGQGQHRSRASTGSPTRTTPSIPKGVSTDKQAAVLQLLQFMLTPEQQAKAYDKGYFYPGPAVKGVDLVDGAAGEPGRDRASSAGRSTTSSSPDNPTEVPLDAKAWSPRSTSGTARSAARR